MCFLKKIYKLKPLLIYGFFLCSTNIDAQYKYSYKKFDPYLGAISAGFLGSSFYLQNQVKPLSENYILSLNRNNVNRFDRIATYQWNPTIARTSDGVAVGSGLMFLYFCFDKNSKQNVFPIAGVAFQSLLLSQALSNSFKLTLRHRPLVYNPEVEMSKKMKSDSRMSFFSAHTTTVSSLSFSFAYAYQTYNAPNKPNYALWTGAFALPAVEAILRVKAGKHYPSDVICGYVVGFASSFIMHKLHKVNK
jgi:membrane-associated phospholipid phosphatase